MIGMPVQKSDECIQAYLDLGPTFGNIVILLFNELYHGFLPHPSATTHRFIELCSEVFEPAYKISYPFAKQKNRYGAEFGREVCVSVNSCVAHCRPTLTRRFDKGDIVSVDVGLCLTSHNEEQEPKGINFDAAFTVPIMANFDCHPGLLAPLKVLSKVCDITERLYTEDITNLIVDAANTTDPPLGIIASLTGHGIGYQLHEPPRIHNYPTKEASVEFPPGFVFCVEPMYSLRKEKGSPISPTYIASDGWSVVTHENIPTTHFETTFCYIIDNGGYKVIDSLGIVKRISETIELLRMTENDDTRRGKK